MCMRTGFFPQVRVSCSSNRANGLGSSVNPSQLMDVAVDAATLLPRQLTNSVPNLSIQHVFRGKGSVRGGILEGDRFQATCRMG